MLPYGREEQNKKKLHTHGMPRTLPMPTAGMLHAHICLYMMSRNVCSAALACIKCIFYQLYFRFCCMKIVGYSVVSCIVNRKQSKTHIPIFSTNETREEKNNNEIIMEKRVHVIILCECVLDC